MKRFGLAPVLLLAALGQPRAAGAAPPPVVAIEIASDVPLTDPRQVRSLIAITPGEPLTEEAVRRTLSNLYAAGIVREVEVRSRPAADGVVAVVALWSNVLVAEVRIEGELGLSRRDLAPIVVRGRGQPLSESRIVRGVFDLQDLYQRRGYQEARVRVRVEDADATGRKVVVVYTVTPGREAVLGEVELEGDLAPFDQATLSAALGLEAGKPFRRRAVEKGVAALEAFLVAREYRAARVGVPEERYDAATGAMHLLLPLTVGPRVVVEVKGADPKLLRQKGLLPFLDEGGYDPALILVAVERIKRFYQEKGHYHVRVDVEREESPELVRLLLRIDPGAQFSIAGLEFRGNEAVLSAELAKLATTAPRQLITLGAGRLVDEVLRADLDNIRSYYTLQGFDRVRVLPPEVREEGRELYVTVPISEGRQRRVAELRFIGAEALGEERLRELLAGRRLLTSGGPFHPFLLEESLQALRATYEEEGYLEAQVSGEPSWPGGESEAVVTVHILEGPRTTIDRIIVRGNKKTDTALIERAIGIEPGQPSSGLKLLEAQRSLSRLGIFSQADVRFAAADPGASTRDVIVRVEEGETRRLVYGVGYDNQDGARALFGYSSTNLAGKGYSLGFDARLGYDIKDERETGRLRLTFDQPYLGTLALPVTYTLFFLDEARESFDVRRWGGRVEMICEELCFGGGRDLEGRRDRLSLVYDYRIVQPTVDLGQLREDRQIRISSLIPTYYKDDRDDPVNPARGSAYLVQLQYAFPLSALSTTEEFLKLFVQGSHHLPLGRAGVLATSWRLGAIEPLRAAGDDSLLDPSLPSSRVSIAERLFAGGSTSHRAYGREQLGIVGRTLLPTGASGGKQSYLPVGGNGLALLNLDWRFPIAGSFGGVLFADAGNVWAGYRDLDVRDLKLGLGLAARYSSPIGPIQLGIGFKLDREPLEDGYEVFLSVGNPF